MIGLSPVLTFIPSKEIFNFLFLLSIFFLFPSHQKRKYCCYLSLLLSHFFKHIASLDHSCSSSKGLINRYIAFAMVHATQHLIYLFHSGFSSSIINIFLVWAIRTGVRYKQSAVHGKPSILALFSYTFLVPCFLFFDLWCMYRWIYMPWFIFHVWPCQTYAFFFEI